MRRRILTSSNGGDTGSTSYEYVDLGLPSGTLWATKNVGAATETDYGDYYQYGKGVRTYDQTSGETYYSGTEKPLAASADTATQVMGSEWHMPTSAQCKELMDSTTFTWETNFNNKSGSKFTAQNGNYIFIPAAGYYDGDYPYVMNKGTVSSIWSSTPANSMDAYYLGGLSSGADFDSVERYYGYSIRGVRDFAPTNIGVLFYNTVTDTKQVFVEADGGFPESGDGWTPIAIEVVPRSHDRYGDGSGGFISLVGMRSASPETGQSVTSNTQVHSIQMFWGFSGSTVGNNIFNTNVGLYGNYATYIPYQTNSASTACSIVSGSTIWPYAGTTTAPTSGASTAYTNSGTYPYVSATTGKACCDFNGIRNTAACYVATSAAPQWTASTVANATGETGTPPAACAGRFKTIGTKSFLNVYSGITSNNLNYGTPKSPKDNRGFWYLPACGELCYVPRYYYEINKTILSLNYKYDKVGARLDTALESLWSSTEGSSYTGSWGLWKFRTGQLTTVAKSEGGGTPVRAFLRYKDGD